MGRMYSLNVGLEYASNIRLVFFELKSFSPFHLHDQMPIL